MYLINFLVAIFLPYLSFLSILAPSDVIPDYFFSDEGAFVAGEFYTVVLYWAGYLRNIVSRGDMTEQQYFFLATVVLVFIAASKIIFTLPFTWITSIFAFGLGVLSLTGGQQNMHGGIRAIMITMSVIILCFSTFILLGMAWFNFTPTDYYYYRNMLINWIPGF